MDKCRKNATHKQTETSTIYILFFTVFRKMVWHRICSAMLMYSKIFQHNKSELKKVFSVSLFKVGTGSMCWNCIIFFLIIKLINCWYCGLPLDGVIH